MERVKIWLMAAVFNRGAMEFGWQHKDGKWLLHPSSITVAQDGPGFWKIYVADCPMILRYTSYQGAKLDAWEFAKSKRRALFGAYRIKLAA